MASDDGERLSQNPLQILLLCVGKTAIMYAKSVQREDCTSVLLDGFRSAVSSTVGLPTAMALIGPVTVR